MIEEGKKIEYKLEKNFFLLLLPLEEASSLMELNLHKGEKKGRKIIEKRSRKATNSVDGKRKSHFFFSLLNFFFEEREREREKWQIIFFLHLRRRKRNNERKKQKHICEDEQETTKNNEEENFPFEKYVQMIVRILCLLWWRQTKKRKTKSSNTHRTC